MVREALNSRDELQAQGELKDWLAGASRSRLQPFVKAARTIRKHLHGILAYVRTGLSNGRVEGMNNKINSVIRRSFGLHSAAAVIAYVRLCCTDLAIPPVRRQQACTFQKSTH